MEAWFHQPEGHVEWLAGCNAMPPNRPCAASDHARAPGFFISNDG
jgi:hypothetical protein